ncbi:MAG: cation:proton antiporter [Planctomycetota bacterium]
MAIPAASSTASTGISGLADAAPLGELTPILGLGLMFLLALLAARIAARLQIPRVTGYLLAGVMLGPSVIGRLAGDSGWGRLFGMFSVQSEELQFLRILSELALGMILFSIGGEFRAEKVRAQGRRIALLATADILGPLVLVTLSMWAFGSTLQQSMLLGILAVAVAPAATLLVLKDLESEGAASSSLLVLVGLNNLFCLMVFPLAAFAAAGTGELSGVLLRLGGSILAGAFIGFGMSVWQARLTRKKDFVLLAFAGVGLGVGVAHSLGDPSLSLVANFAIGATLVNSSTRGREVFEHLEGFAYPFYVFFFVAAGAELHLDSLAHLGVVGMVYVVGRSVGKVGGVWAIMKASGLSRRLSPFLGLSLLCQAGVAIGLSQTLATQQPEIGVPIQSIILASVVLFEVAGPLLVRSTLIHSGEVKLVTILPNLGAPGGTEPVRNAFYELRRSLGLVSLTRLDAKDGVRVEHVMRRHAETLRDNQTFDSIIKTLSHGRYDLYPVVDKERRFLGLISYNEIRDIIFDEEIARLVIARELLMEEDLLLRPDQGLEEALDIFQSHDALVLPVVEDPGGERQLVGVALRRDIVAAAHKTSPSPVASEAVQS